MTGNPSLAARRAAIDERVEAALASAGPDRLTPARRTAMRPENRWCGQLLALAHEAARDDGTSSGDAAADDASTLSSAAAVELLRGYYRLREGLLLRHAGAEASFGPDSTARLLGSDYLFASAYTALASVESERTAACFDVITAVSGTIIEGLGERYLPRAGPPVAYDTFVDRTAGALGRGAAVLGATLAGADERHREQFGRVGRGVGAIERIRATLDGDVDGPNAPDARELERQVRARREEIADALRELDAAFDVSGLRSFVTRTVTDDATDAPIR